MSIKWHVVNIVRTSQSNENITLKSMLRQYGGLITDRWFRPWVIVFLEDYPLEYDVSFYGVNFVRWDSFSKTKKINFISER